MAIFKLYDQSKTEVILFGPSGLLDEDTLDVFKFDN